MEYAGQAWVRWEEMVSYYRGRREMRYYVLDDGGGRYLAVVGREKSTRHMTYAVQAKFFHFLMRNSATASPSSGAAAAVDAVPSDRKLRSRRQVEDWLSLLVSDSMPCGLPPTLERYSDGEDASTANMRNSKVFFSGQLASEKFSWLGSSWDSKKRRKHYRSFYRNGITISVNDFVYVLTEDNKRLVAHIEDLFEDMMATNMVAVRWFHKVDEVSIVLPSDTNDREIFFSLCLQEFSVECIDGLASVLGFEDFEKFQKEEQRYSLWEPYLCRRLIDNADVKLFDITRVQGYWSQNILRSMYPSCLKLRLKVKNHGLSMDGNKDCVLSQENGNGKPLPDSGLLNDIGNSKGLSAGNRLERKAQVYSSMEGLEKNVLSQTSISRGQDVELFSQDSGIRGCWFCCVVLRSHRDKIKVQYRDVLDADGIGNLEEWVSTSRIAAPDKFSLRMIGRPIVRPRPSKKDEIFSGYEYGEVVDAWWHDGWWEGIVISNDCAEDIRVYFPGEQRVSIFLPSDLRSSQDWVENKWNRLNKRPDVATLLLSELDSEKSSDCITFQASPTGAPTEAEPNQEKEHRRRPPVDASEECRSQLAKDFLQETRENSKLDLARNHHSDGLRWSSTRKRTQRRPSLGRELAGPKRPRIKLGHKCFGSISRPVLAPKPLKIAGDQENCKNSCDHDPLFGAVMALCSSLVMT